MASVTQLAFFFGPSVPYHGTLYIWDASNPSGAFSFVAAIPPTPSEYDQREAASAMLAMAKPLKRAKGSKRQRD
jgi:hypothetical protein